MSEPADLALKQLALVQQLTVDAGRSASADELFFKIVNHTVKLCPYDRAVLWDGSSRSILAVSGQSSLQDRSPLAEHWRGLLSGDAAPKTAGVYALPDTEHGRALKETVGGVSVFWLPVPVNGNDAVGLWLERWGGLAWDDATVAPLASLMEGYALAWRAVVPRPRRLRLHRPVLAVCAVLALAALWLVRLPIRVVAECEVIPSDPFAVAAPLDGVILSVAVQPGQMVRAGELLFSYDPRGIEEELDVARQQVEFLRASLQRSRMEEFSKSESRGEASLLAYRLRQEEIREELARKRVALLQVRAERDGMAVIDAPHEWRGRPVQIGERVLLIVQPQATRLSLSIREGDYVDFPAREPVSVYLHTDATNRYDAQLSYVAPHATALAGGGVAFTAEAEWTDAPASARLGQKGTAVLYGPRVHLATWLLRRPWAAVRATLGW